MRFENKVAFITGSSSGIGAATARLIAQEGAAVVVVASGKLDKAKDVADDDLQWMDFEITPILSIDDAMPSIMKAFS